MISVIYHRDFNQVSVEGHAQSGDVGHDLVCASASILTYTLAAFVESMKSEGQTKHRAVKLKDGYAFISCDPPRRYKGAVTLVFDSICAGYELLSKDYPNNVSYKIVKR